MENIRTIYSTISNGQVHIAADAIYIGSVASYNNYFTQFFAWLSGRSMTVDFDGKLRSVNKESYMELVRSLVIRVDEIRELSMFRSVVSLANPPGSIRRMRDVIDSDDRRVLFQKLAIAISQENTEKALLMIGKGAELDTDYFERSGQCPSFGSDRVCCITPIEQVA